jgi:hypothetical protein
MKISEDLPPTALNPMVEPNTKNGSHPETQKRADTADTSETEAKPEHQAPEPFEREPETTFATVPDDVLDRFLPATRDQLQRLELRPPGAPCDVAGITVHDALPPAHTAAGEWEHRGDDDELPLVKGARS